MAHHDGTAHFPAGALPVTVYPRSFPTGLIPLPRVFLPTWPPVGSNKAPFPDIASNFTLPPYKPTWGYWNTVIV